MITGRKTYVLSKPFCDEHNVFKWIRQACGMNGKRWQSALAPTRFNGDLVYRIWFEDDGVEVLFKLTFSEHLIDLPA